MKKQFVFVITLCMMLTVLLTPSFAMEEEPIPYETVTGKIISVTESSIEVQATEDKTYVVLIGYFKNKEGFDNLDLKTGNRVILEGFKAADAKNTVVYNGLHNSAFKGTVDVSSPNTDIIIKPSSIGMIDISRGNILLPGSNTIKYTEAVQVSGSINFNLGGVVDPNYILVNEGGDSKAVKVQEKITIGDSRLLNNFFDLNELQNRELFYASSITVKGKTVKTDVYYDEETSSIIVNKK